MMLIICVYIHTEFIFFHKHKIFFKHLKFNLPENVFQAYQTKPRTYFCYKFFHNIYTYICVLSVYIYKQRTSLGQKKTWGNDVIYI